MSLPSSSSSSSTSSSSSSQSSPSSSCSSSSSCGYGVGRKNACSLINNPIDIAEHILRLQNWSEQNETKDWGKEYANNPLIDVSTNEGGFDYADLDMIKSLRPARQPQTYNDCWSDSLLKSLCKQFFLCNFQDPATGKERISYIAEKSLTDPTTTIQLGDILGNISYVKYPRMKGIYCEPFVRYAQNYGDGSFDKIIQITNSNADTYDSSYVIGIDNTTKARLMWTRAHVLWNAFRQIEPPPSDLTDLTWVTEDQDAEWVLDKWFTWMGALNTDGTPEGITFEPKKRISFTVPYEIGKNWFISFHFKLQLPHQTNDEAIECLIYKTNKITTMGRESVNVSVVLYGSASEIEFYIQDSYDITNPSWQDSYDLQSEAPAQSNDVQDI